MAKVKNAFTTYQAVGNREDLSGTIYNIDPFDSPFVSAAGKRDVSNTRTFDWQTEKLPAVNGDNARQEGFELDRSAATPSARLKNVCQISSRDATVSGSQENSDAAGKASEMGRQMALQGKALKRDMEVIACSAQAIVYGDDSVTPVPRRTRAFIHWLKTNALVPTPGGTPVITLPVNDTDAFPAISAGSRVEFTEALLGKVMARCYNNGAEPTMTLMGPTLKRAFSLFVGRSTSQVLVGKNEAVATVDIYASDFGRLKALPSRWVDPNVVLLIDPGYVKIAYFRSMRSIDIATIGDAQTKLMLAEWGIEVSNEAAHGALLGVAAPAGLDPSSMG